MFPGGRCRVKPRRWTPSVPRGTSRPPAGYDKIQRSRVRGANATVRAIPRAQHGDRPSSSRITPSGQVPATRRTRHARPQGPGAGEDAAKAAPGPLSRRGVLRRAARRSPARPHLCRKDGRPQVCCGRPSRETRTTSAVFHVEQASGLRAPHRTPVFHVEHADGRATWGVAVPGSPWPDFAVTPHDPRGDIRRST
jgi:hypothetical protein